MVSLPLVCLDYFDVGVDENVQLSARRVVVPQLVLADDVLLMYTFFSLL